MRRRLGSSTFTILISLGAAATSAPISAAASTAPTPAPAATVAPAALAAPTVRAPAGVGFPAVQVADVAHRGGSAHAPENTLAAFREAKARRADAFELDVRQTRDRRLVILHDATLARTTDVERVYPRRFPWRVEDFTLAEIRRLDAGSWFDRRYRGERVPTLAETLRAMEGSGLGLLLEVKSPGSYPGIGRRVRAELRARPGWLRPGRLIVQSFDEPFVRSFHHLMPQVPTAVLGTPGRDRLAAVRSYADFVNPPYRDVTSGYVAAVHRAGLRIHTWTVNDAPTMRRVIAAGVDGVITDRPGVAREVISGASASLTPAR